MMIIHFKFETFFWHMRASQALISLCIAQAGLGLCGLLVYSTVAQLPTGVDQTARIRSPIPNFADRIFVKALFA